MIAPIKIKNKFYNPYFSDFISKDSKRKRQVNRKRDPLS